MPAKGKVQLSKRTSEVYRKTDSMEVLINNKPTLINGSATLQEALNTLQLPHFKGVAVAINEHVIPQPKWPTHILQSNDRILIIRATQGG